MTSLLLIVQNPDLEVNKIDFGRSYHLLQLIKNKLKALRRHVRTPENLIPDYPSTPEALDAQHPDVFEKAFRVPGPMKAQHAYPYIYLPEFTYIYIYISMHTARKSLPLSLNSLSLSLFLSSRYRRTTATCWPMRSFGRGPLSQGIHIYRIHSLSLGSWEPIVYIELQRKTYAQCLRPRIYTWLSVYIYIYIYILVSWSLALGPWLLGP